MSGHQQPENNDVGLPSVRPIIIYPFVKLVFPLMFGVFIGSLLPFSLPWGVVILVLILAIWSVEKWRDYSIYVIYFLIFLLGIKTWQIHRKTPTTLPEEKTFYIGVIDDDPKIREKTIQTPVRLVACADSGGFVPAQGRVFVYFRKDSITQLLRYGDSVMFMARLQRVRNLGNPYEFDYRKFLARKGIFHSGFADSGRTVIIGTGGGKPLLLRAYRLRHSLLDIYRKYGISGKEYQILAALTLGYRQALSREVQQSFAHSGAMHILAVSGLHVGILFGVLLLILRPFAKGRFRWLALAVILAVLWGFAVITGLSPSVRRSAFMFSLIAITLMIRRQTNIYNSLAASAFFMLLFFPTDLFSVGFWLSYLAVISIVSLYPLIYRLIYVPRPFNKLWALLSVSIAAQIGTMPIGLYVFHQFPNYFLLTNLLAIPLAGIILYLAMALFLFNSIGFVGKILGKALVLSVKILWQGIHFIENLPGATSTDIYLTFGQMLILYGIFISFILFFVQKNRRFAFYFVALAIVFQLINIEKKIRLTIPPRMIVYNIPGHTAINFISSGQNILLIDNSLAQDKNKIHNTILPYWKYAGFDDASFLVLNRDSVFTTSTFVMRRNLISFFDRKILLLYDRKVLDMQTDKRFPVDLIMIYGNPYLKISELSNFFSFKKIILCPSNKPFRNLSLSAQCDSLGLDYYDVSQQGAFIYKVKN